MGDQTNVVSGPVEYRTTQSIADPNTIGAFPVPVAFQPVPPNGAPTFDVPTRADALAAREREKEGFRFALFHTAPGKDAHVKRLSLNDRTMLGALPDAMRSRILKLILEARGDGGPARTEAQFRKNQKRSDELAQAFCVAGFIRPCLVFTEAELTTDDTWLVSDLSPDERMAYYLACTSFDEDQAKRLKSLTEQPDSPVDDLAADGGDRNAGL